MKKLLIGTFVFTATLLTSSCQSGRAPETESAKSPIVEVFLEFGGPASKWVGPSSWMVNLVAKQEVEVKVAFEAPKPDGYTERSIASSKEEKVAAKKTLAFADARAQLNGLAIQIAEADEEESPCLNWVRAKLIREDGTTLEKEGCRNSKGWSGRASALAAEWAQL